TQQSYRRGAGTIELGIGADDVQVHLGTVAAPADIAVHLVQVGRLLVAPAALMLDRASDVGCTVAAAPTVLNVGADLAERSAIGTELTALVGEAILHLHR